jgi:hypothetical protein
MFPRRFDATCLVQTGKPVLIWPMINTAGAIALHIRVTANRARALIKQVFNAQAKDMEKLAEVFTSAERLQLVKALKKLGKQAAGAAPPRREFHHSASANRYRCRIKVFQDPCALAGTCRPFEISRPL